MTSANKVEVRIGGKDYIIKGMESEEYIQRVALFIDKKMSEINKMNNSLSTSMIAVLTAINVADEYFKAYESENNYMKDSKARNAELDELRSKISQFEKDNSELNSQNTSLKTELAKIKEDETGYKKDSAIYNDKIKRLIRDNEIIAKDNRNLKSTIANLQNEILDLRNTLDRATLPNQIQLQADN